MASTRHRILVPTDFSEASDRALELARRIAAPLAAEIHFLHVRVLLEEPHVVEEGQRELERLLARADQHARDALGRKTAPVAGEVIHTHLVRGLSAPESIVQTALDLGCDLIVMGTHGRRGLKHLFLGSVAERIVRTAPMPVLTVRPNATFRELQGARILLPYDFSERSAAAEAAAADWARALEGRVTLLHVVEPIVYPEFYAVDILPEDMLDKICDRTKKSLEDVAARTFKDLPVSVEVAVGKASETIAEAASPESYDLVIMPTRGLSPIEHLLLGSVAAYVVRHATVPVLTLREAAN